MSNRCYVATRKGLFTIDRGASKWSISHAAFVGDNVTLVMHDPRNGDLFAALNHGHFGIKLHRSKDGGETWPEIAVPAYPPMPEGYVPKPHPFTGKADRLGPEAYLGTRPCRRRPARRCLVRDNARRIVQIRRQRRNVGTESPALGPPEARGLGAKRRGVSGYSFDLCRSARLASRKRRRFDGRRLDYARQRKVLGPDGQAACARNIFHPNRCTIPTFRMCIASRSAKRIQRSSGCNIITASSDRRMARHRGPKLRMSNRPSSDSL